MNSLRPKILSSSAMVIVYAAVVIHGICYPAGPAKAQTDTTPPYVVSTTPMDGATGVSVDLTSVSITFSEPMGSSSSYMTNFDLWGSGPPRWSSDQRTMTIPKYSTSPLPSGVTLTFTLGTSVKLADLAGNLLSQPGFEPGAYAFSFLVGTQPYEKPRVVSTSPANGALNVSLDLESASISFDRPMKGGYSISSNFPSYTVSWSADNQICNLRRNDLSVPLLPGTTYVFALNAAGSTSFQDLSGVPLEECTFSFTTVANYELHKIPENPAKGFNWPYYLSVPRELSSPAILLVETNNTGGVSDDWAIHDQAALNLVKWRSSFAVDLDAPLLVPTFPRPIGTHVNPPLWLIYTHALDRDSLTTNVAGLERIDLQLIAMIQDAQERLRTMGYVVDRKIFINGYSASGSFANRFTLLHPELIKAAASGSPGGWPTVPVCTWSNETLNYPVGIADLESLIGQPFNLSAFRRVPQYIYVGDIDNNDAVDYRDGFDVVDEEMINRLFGDGEPYIVERWPHAEAIFKSVGSKAAFGIYPGVAHTITSGMFEDLRRFFASHRQPEVRPVVPSVILLLD